MRSVDGQILIPIYTTRGDVEALLAYPYLYNRSGEWIGWVTPEREVFSVLGFYAGYVTEEPRILRRRAAETTRAAFSTPTPPGRVFPPASVPLAPLMRELTESLVDVLQDEPERLHTLDVGELRSDLD